jgi:NAD(P)-dependent dehydrogenase (short-subunit alcohol dehydrogenase family)
MRRLAGIVALVTGGGSGIGAALAAGLAAAGARQVWIADVDEAAAAAVAARCGGAATPLRLDVRDAAAFEAAVATVIATRRSSW